MKKINYGIMFLIGFMLLILNSIAFAENIVVIVNEKSPVLSENKSSLDAKEVKDIYLGKTKFWKGALIKAVNQKDKALLASFIEKICNMHVPDYQVYWVKLELEVGISSPKVMETSKDVLRFVQYEKNAIGYVLESEVLDAPGVKIVLSLGE